MAGCDARKHECNVSGSNGRWSIDFGANTVNLSYAIDQCSRTLKQWLDRKLSGEHVTIERLQSGLTRDVVGSVSHRRGRWYDVYPLSDGYMTFGATGILVSDFVWEFLLLTGGSTILALQPGQLPGTDSVACPRRDGGSRGV